MKRIHLLTAALLCAVTSPFARGESLTETISLTFSESDFSITTDSDGLTHIESLRDIASYSDDTSSPALPYFSTNLTVPAQATYKSCDVRYDKYLLMSDVVIAPNTESVPTGSQALVTPSTASKTPAYSQALYPSSSFNYVATSRTDDYSLAHFRYTPFIYDAAKKELYFVSSYDVTVNIDVPTKATGVQRVIPVESENTYYIIITNEALKSAFEPLRRWKEIKGYDTKIVTVESIYQSNSTDDKPLQIKKYIAKKKIDGLKYVLLGGDDQIVPVRYVYSAGGTTSSDKIPADLYYGCLDSKSFDWDLNKDGIYGTFADSISLASSVYVSRVPVRTPEDATAFVNKLLKYEKSPKYHNKILTGGSVLWGYTPNIQYDDDPVTSSHHSDAETKSTNLYNNYIKPYWSGQRDMLFDTATSFTGGRDYQVNATNLSDQLSNGYDFVSILVHGDPDCWDFREPTLWDPGWQYMIEGESSKYGLSDASSQTNSSYSIITTIACHTNWFDYPTAYPYSKTVQPSLSESFIRNPNNGVIAYLGSSRAGWGKPLDRHALGPSLQYEAFFYKYLFSDEIEDKNFGKIVAKAKMAKIADSMDGSQQDRNADRWLQFSINPIGDPEMPIFTETPKTFDNLSITVNGRTVKVFTGVDDCRVCITGINNSYPNYQYGSGLFTFNYVPEQFNVCVTKQNYIPKVYSISSQANGQMKMVEIESVDQLMEKDMAVSRLAQPENKILGCTPNPSGDIATINTQIEEESASASLVFTSLMGNKEKEVEIPAGETSVTTSVASLPSGIHLVTLMVNGRACDSYRLVKK